MENSSTTERGIEVDVEHVTDPVTEQRQRLQTRHAEALARLMETRRDLRGVHALADFVDEAVRWSA